MNRNKNILVLGLTLFNLVTLSFLWYGYLNKSDIPPERRHGMKPPAIMKFLETEMLLTEQQKVKFQNEREHHLVISREISKKQHHLKREILVESFQSEPDLNKINYLTKEIGELQENLEKQISDHFVSLNSILFEDQKKIFERIIKEASMRSKDKLVSKIEHRYDMKGENYDY